MSRIATSATSLGTERKLLRPTHLGVSPLCRKALQYESILNYIKLCVYLYFFIFFYRLHVYRFRYFIFRNVTMMDLNVTNIVNE